MSCEVTYNVEAPRSYEDYLNEVRKPKSQLGKSDFLSLLAAQLQYQDPLEPMQDSAFVAQLAQFSSLEQLENLNTTMSSFQYFSLAGKYVVAEGSDDVGQAFSIAGIVDRVVYSGGVAYVQVGDMLLKASGLTQVYDKDLVTGSNNPLLEAARLIGTSVTGYVTGEDGELSEVSGTVTGVGAENGEIIARLDTGERLAVGNIVTIRQAGADIVNSTENSDELGTETEQGTQEQTENENGGTTL
jgi:flagellar basal-body rod modification protein FlgD